MAWEQIRYSKNQIKNAGWVIIDENTIPSKRKEAMNIINNWRAAHAYPLYVIFSKLKRMLQDDKDTFVVSRLKRLDSIEQKLKRNETMRLTGMQDLGGCRVVTNSIEKVYRIADNYQNSKIQHELYKENDYIKSPKSSGYRSLHRVYKYHSNNPKNSYNNMCIEIQFRTHLQHLWATAVETMGVYTHCNLKAGMGNEHYLRFFSLVSSLFALKEGMPIVQGTPDNKLELMNAIKHLNEKHNILPILNAIKLTISIKLRKKLKAAYYLLILNYKTGTLTIKSYRLGEIESGNKLYNQIENGNEVDAVLITAQSFDQLQAAYPNYFLDIQEFIDVITEEMQQ